jgi:hypothetical protein
MVSEELDCDDCSVFLSDLTALREKHASKCEELDVLRVELAELQSRPTCLVLILLALLCMKRLLSFALA